MPIISIFLLTFLIIGSIWVIWRFYSNHYHLPCPSWLGWLVELNNPFAKAHQAQSIIDTLPLFNNIQILDIGCGPGRVLVPLAQKISAYQGHITGIDIQSEMIEKTHKKADELGITNITLQQGSVETIKLLQHYYDVALMVCLLGEIPEAHRLNVLTTIASTLKPHALLIITEIIFDPHFQKQQTVVTLLQQANFIPHKCIGTWFAYTIHFKKI